MWKLWCFAILLAFAIGCFVTFSILTKKNALYEAFFKQYSPIVYGHKTYENTLKPITITNNQPIDYGQLIEIANELSMYRTNSFVFIQSNTNIRVQLVQRYANYVLDIKQPPLKRWLIYGGVGLDVNIIAGVHYQFIDSLYAGVGFFKTPYLTIGYQF